MSARLASDLIWADPATDETELLSGMSPGQQNLGRGVRLDADGFGPSLRGGDSCCFGVKAIEAFLKQHELMCIVRAHQVRARRLSSAAHAATSHVPAATAHPAPVCDRRLSRRRNRQALESRKVRESLRCSPRRRTTGAARKRRVAAYSSTTVGSCRLRAR